MKGKFKEQPSAQKKNRGLFFMASPVLEGSLNTKTHCSWKSCISL